MGYFPELYWITIGYLNLFCRVAKLDPGRLRENHIFITYHPKEQLFHSSLLGDERNQLVSIHVQCILENHNNPEKA